MSKVIYKLGDDISTDIIYPGRYMATVLPTETPQFAFADIKELNDKLNSMCVSPGSIIAAGKNFGCGSSREQAVSALKGHEIIVVARSFARIFLQNSVNLGLQIIACPDIEANEGNDIEITAAEMINKTNGKSYRIEPMPKSRLALIKAGGLIAYTRKRILEKQSQDSRSAAHQ